jgi:RNA polymerase sigma-70 factor (ECF subfamily)
VTASGSAIPASPVSVSPDLDAVVDRFGRPALSLARRVIGDDALAEDVVQEAFMAYWRNPAAFDAARGSLASWLLAMVHHKAVDAVRRQESRRRVVGRLIEGHVSPVSAAVDEIVEQRAIGERVRAALGRLSRVQREAIVLAYWGGYTQAQIADLTGTPLGTVKTRTASAMRLMAGELTTEQPRPRATAPAPAGH